MGDNVKRNLGIVSLLTAGITWAFFVGLIPWFSEYLIAWVALVAVSALLAVLCRKTIWAKLSIVLLLLEAIAYPFFFTIGRSL